MEKLRGVIEAIILDAGSIEDSEGNREKGPRSLCVFWKDLVKEVKRNGSRVAVGIKGQFATFGKVQPG